MSFQQFASNKPDANSGSPNHHGGGNPRLSFPSSSSSSSSTTAAAVTWSNKDNDDFSYTGDVSVSPPPPSRRFGSSMLMHSSSSSSSRSPSRSPSGSPMVPPPNPASSRRMATAVRNNSSKKPNSSRRAKDFSEAENLALCKAWISTSEDAVRSTDQKLVNFWSNVFEDYKLFIDDLNNHLVSKQRQIFIQTFKQANHREPTLDEINNSPVTLYSYRTAPSIQQKWSKCIQPDVHKFCGAYKHITNDGTGPSGTDDDEKFDRACVEFERRTKKKQGYFRKFRKCWEYLRTKAKFTDSTNASLSIGGDDSSSKRKRPAGRDKSKAESKMDEIMNTVRDKYGNNGNALANTLKVFGDDIKGAITDGFVKLTDATSEASYLEHCDPDFSKEYATLKLKASLKRLREGEGEEQNHRKKNSIIGTNADNAFVLGNGTSDSDSDIND